MQQIVESENFKTERTGNESELEKSEQILKVVFVKSKDQFRDPQSTYSSQ